MKKIYSVNDQVEMVVRPESVVIGKEDYKTTVKKSLFMGENHEYEVEWNGQILQISGSNPFGKRIYELEDTMHIGFEGASLHLL